MYHDKIRETYRSRFNELSPTKRFHFVSRMNLIEPDEWTRGRLDELESWFFGGNDKLAPVDRLRLLAKKTPDLAQLNAAAERKPYIESSPWLFGYELQLFQVLHARTQFEVDLLPQLKTISSVSSDDITRFAADPRALAVLATYLIDIYYLHNRLLENDEEALIPLEILDAALDTPLDPAQQPRLNVYLLTHCIIGETLFYARAIPTNKRTYYENLSTRLIHLAEKHWETLTLDNKLEIALCLQLVRYPSDLIDRAVQEADANYAAKTGFITDPKMPHKNDLEWAEHRNVLYLMVTTS